MESLNVACVRPTLASIISLTFLSTGPMLVSPALDSIAQAFPQYPYSVVLLVYTLPSLMAIPFALISGAMVGRRVKYRPALIASIALYVASGAAVILMETLTGVLICRAIFGISAGLIGPHSNALIIRCFDERERGRYIGYSLVCVGLSGVMFQMLGGYLCSFGWRYTFAAHFMGLIPLVLVAHGMREPSSLTEHSAQKDYSPPQKQRLLPPLPAAPIFVAIAATYMVSQTKSLTMSSIVANEGLGNSTTSGFILSFGVMGAVLSGLLFPIFQAHVRRFRTALLMMVLTVATALTLVNNVAVIAGGYFIGVIAFLINHNLLILSAAAHVPPEEAGTITGFAQCAEKAGVFFATGFVAVTMSAARLVTGNVMYKAPIAAGAVTYFFIGLISLVYTVFSKRVQIFNQPR